jgi:tetratricopeptide (TPR) repeat protein
MPRFPLLLLLLGSALALASGCNSLRSPPPFPEQPPNSTSSSAQPPAPPSRVPARQFRLGAAASSLVDQAHKQVATGDFGLAAATVERAMRIEPDNPLLWIELGRVRDAAGDYAQADSMARKALTLATGDPRAQASAYRLIADAMRGLRRNQEASEADARANALSPR